MIIINELTSCKDLFTEVGTFAKVVAAKVSKLIVKMKFEFVHKLLSLLIRETMPTDICKR